MSKIKKIAYVLQGDVILWPCQIPELAKPKNLIIAEGEVTGHHHQFLDMNAVHVFISPDQQQYVHVKEPTILYHEEHDHVQVPQGTYKILIQRELNELDEIQAVRD